MTRLVGTLYVFVLGFVAYELQELENDRRLGMSDAERRPAVESYLTEILETGSFPQFSRFLELDGVAPGDDDFCFGVDSLLEGMAARLQTR